MTSLTLDKAKQRSGLEENTGELLANFPFILPGNAIEEVPAEMNLTALPGDSLKVALDCPSKTLMVIRHHQSYFFESSFFKISEYSAPRLFGLGLGNVHSENLSVAVFSCCP